MSILYIDEAGTPLKRMEPRTDPNDGNPNYFVMCGLLIDNEELEELFMKFSDIKEKYLKDTHVELKSTLKKLRFKDNLEQQYNHSELKEMVQQDVYTLIESSNIKLFGAQVNKVDLFKREIVRSKDDVYQMCFETILEELATFINTTHHNSKIITMIDSMGKSHDRKIYNAYQSALNSKTESFKVFDRQNFSPTINFVDSEFTFGLQLVDFSVGALWRGVERGQKKHSIQIKKNFPVDANGEFLNYTYCFCGK